MSFNRGVLFAEEVGGGRGASGCFFVSVCTLSLLFRGTGVELR